MAGGRWSKSYEQRYQAARARGEPSPFATDGGRALPEPTGPPTVDAELTAGRHCWVLGPEGDPGPFPGVLLAWRREGGTWWGRVAYARRDHEDRPVLTDGWIPASALRPQRDPAP